MHSFKLPIYIPLCWLGIWIGIWIYWYIFYSYYVLYNLRHFSRFVSSVELFDVPPLSSSNLLIKYWICWNSSHRNKLLEVLFLFLFSLPNITPHLLSGTSGVFCPAANTLTKWPGLRPELILPELILTEYPDLWTVLVHCSHSKKNQDNSAIKLVSKHKGDNY